MQNITKLEIKKTNLPNYYRLIINIGDILSNGYLISLDDIQYIKNEIENLINERLNK